MGQRPKGGRKETPKPTQGRLITLFIITKARSTDREILIMLESDEIFGIKFRTVESMPSVSDRN